MSNTYFLKLSLNNYGVYEVSHRQAVHWRRIGLGDEKAACTLESACLHFLALWNAQDGRCAASGIDLNLSVPMGCNVDHDHETGEIRGLLLGRVNILEGQLRSIHEDPMLWLYLVVTLIFYVHFPPARTINKLFNQVGKIKAHMKAQDAREKAMDLMRPLTEEEIAKIDVAMNRTVPDDYIIAQIGADQCLQGSLKQLRPQQWLNDEVIHYFLVVLANRDAELCESDPTRKRSHFFKSFFFTQLLNIGHCDPNMNGRYEYKNVKRWSEKVPGKDVFGLDKIIFPINQGGMHWVCAVAFMQEKRIQFYDSLGGDGMNYMQVILQYLNDEHHDKRKLPLPEIDDWQLVKSNETVPRQQNSYDCGVFVCIFADFLSLDCPLVFNQDHVTQYRKHIAMSILIGKYSPEGIKRRIKRGRNRGGKTRAAQKEASPVYPMAPKVVLVCEGPKSHVDHTYRDFSTMPIEAEYIDPILSPGIAFEDVPFARLLHLVVTAEDGKGAIAWRPHGRAFVIVSPSKLEIDEVLLKYFDRNRYPWFLNQLKNYGLKSITHGKDKGSFYHECFLRGLPYLTKYMPDTKDTGRLICDPKNEPDFYTISGVWPVPSIDNMAFVQNNPSKTSLDNMHTAAATAEFSSQQQPLQPIGSSRSRGDASRSTDGAVISAGLTPASITLLGQKLKQPEPQETSQSMTSMHNAYVPPVPLQPNSNMLSAVPQINNQSLQDTGLDVNPPVIDTHINDNNMTHHFTQEMAKHEDASSRSKSHDDNGSTSYGENDVLFGKGYSVNCHIGNRRFRDIVQSFHGEYLTAQKLQKVTIAKNIVDIVRNKGGQYMQKDSNGTWVEAPTKRAVKKTLQALRERLDVRNQKIRSKVESFKNSDQLV